MINPYELLGVTINSSKKDIKHIYYQLSLLIHPDKGGNSEDMITLKKAYDFIMKEIEVINLNVTIEQLENNFKEFCILQTQEIPLFQDIYAEAFDLPKFNEYFNNNLYKVKSYSEKGYSSIIKEGYGDIMNSNEVNNNNNIDNKYIDIETGPITNVFNNINIYKTPQESIVCENVFDFTVIAPINDYSMNSCGLFMTDYKVAFTDNISVFKKNDQFEQGEIDEQGPIKSIEELIKERNNNDNIFKINSNTNNEYIWSFEGLLNSKRERIYDFTKLE